MRTWIAAVATFALGAALIHAPVFAAPDTDPVVIAPSQAAALEDQRLLEDAKTLAYAKRYDEALTVLAKIENKNTPVVQNYFGYASRNAGDIEASLSHYRAALDLDPDYTPARSYMGIALLLAGDNRGALEQMVEIEKRVGTEHRDYRLLFEAVEMATKGQQFDY